MCEMAKSNASWKDLHVTCVLNQLRCEMARSKMNACLEMSESSGMRSFFYQHWWRNLEVLGGPPTPPIPFEKTLLSDFGTKIQIFGAKTQIYSAQTQICGAKIQIFEPKSNQWIFVPLKTSRFVRGNLPTLPAFHPPTPSSALVKTSNAHLSEWIHVVHV